MANFIIYDTAHDEAEELVARFGALDVAAAAAAPRTPPLPPPLHSDQSLELRFDDGFAGVVRGLTELYPWWRQLINDWCQAGYDVYLASPFFQIQYIEEALEMLVNANSERRGNMYIYTREKPSVNRRRLWNSVKKNVFIKIRNGRDGPLFHAKFVAGLPSLSSRPCSSDETAMAESAEIMITSGNFTNSHLARLSDGGENHETVSFIRQSRSEFNERFLAIMNQICIDEV